MSTASSFPNLFKIKKNQITMMQKRGYVPLGVRFLDYNNLDQKQLILAQNENKVKETDNFATVSYANNENEILGQGYTLDNFIQKYTLVTNNYNNSFIDKSLIINFRQSLSQIYWSEEKKSYTFVYYTANPTEGKSEPGYKFFAGRRLKSSVGNNVIIRGKDFPPKIRSELNLSPASDKNNLQVLSEAMFLYNPTNHYLVPKHSLVQDSKGFLERNDLKKDQLPLMQRNSDIICRYYGFEIGDIVKVEIDNIGYYSTVGKSLFFRAVVDK